MNWKLSQQTWLLECLASDKLSSFKCLKKKKQYQRWTFGIRRLICCLTKLQAIKRRTWILLLLFFILLALIGAAVGYLWLGSSLGGVILALIIGGIYAFSMIFNQRVVMRMNGAREVTEDQAPPLPCCTRHGMVAQIPMPRVYIVDDPSSECICDRVQSSKCGCCSNDRSSSCDESWELRGVIGHEVSHIRNYDIRISTDCSGLASAITMLSSIGGRMMVGRWP